MLDTLMRVLEVCAPLFAMLFLGYWLRRRGTLNQSAHGFISAFVYRYSLPVLIFPSVAAQDFRELLDIAIIVSTLSVTFLILFGGLILSRLLDRDLRGPVVLGAFAANTAYVGFPLARNAFGEAGFDKASIVNAIVLPTFVVLIVLLLGARHKRSSSYWQKIKPAILSPVVLSAFLGIVCSLLLYGTSVGAGLRENGPVVKITGLFLSIIEPIGQVGLPLALLAVGASLKLDVSFRHKWLLAVCALGKLIVAPALTLLVCRFGFADASPVSVGTAVLLMATPVAVSLYIISAEFDAEPDFVATLLVTTTLGSCVTIPLWVALLI